jgi:transcriptional regulator with XRE-family HTH domain
VDANLGPEQLRSARQASGLTQQQAAERLGVSQTYLAFMEGGRRPVTARLASRIVRLYGLGPVALPLNCEIGASWDSPSLAAAIAGLGYPGFRQRNGGKRQNPATVLLAAISTGDIEVRILESLPWLAVEYNNLNWEWLIREAKVRDVQNRLGFIVTLARQIAEQRGDSAAAGTLRGAQETLERARLAREDTLCQASLTEVERRWLRRTRPREARHWKLLSDLKARLLPYAA